MAVEPLRFSAGRKQMALGFTLFHTKEGGIMSDFEMISVVIMLFMLVISVMSLYKNDK